jgi:hypothetical protein
MSSVDYTSMSTRQLEKQARDAKKRMESIKRDGSPGKGLSGHEAEKARASSIESAKQAAAVASATKRELERRAGEERRTLRERFRGGPSFHERLAAAEESKQRLKKESREFNLEMARAMKEREAAEHARKVAAGLVYQPVGDGGGDAAAAVFSSAATWRAVKREIRADRLAEPSLDARTLVHLWHILNLLEEAGAPSSFTATSPPAGRHSTSRIPTASTSARPTSSTWRRTATSRSRARPAASR